MPDLVFGLDLMYFHIALGFFLVDFARSFSCFFYNLFVSVLTWFLTRLYSARVFGSHLSDSNYFGFIVYYSGLKFIKFISELVRICIKTIQIIQNMEQIYIIIYICTIPVSYILYSFCNFIILLAPGGPLTLYKTFPLLFISISFASSYNFLSSCLSVLVIS